MWWTCGWNSIETDLETGGRLSESFDLAEDTPALNPLLKVWSAELKRGPQGKTMRKTVLGLKASPDVLNQNLQFKTMPR